MNNTFTSPGSRSATPEGSRARGFTLIELLVVLCIIGVLMGMLLPAVQRVREVAGRAQCSNNLKQIGYAFQMHQDSYGFLPDGGESWDPIQYPRTWQGDTPAIAPSQNWGWAYQILPFIEQNNLWRNTDDQFTRSIPVKLYFCPSRRSPMQVYDPRYGNSGMIDYAGNGGTSLDEPDLLMPGNGRNGTVVRRPNGTPLRSSQVNLSRTITDGTSNTLLVGEKRMRMGSLGSSQIDDDQGYTDGWDVDTIRWGINSPAPDRNAEWTPDRFGSRHPAGFNGLLADGSVRSISYSIDSALGVGVLGTWQRLCTRDDGLPLEGSDF
jgi:prepilin-type N-terminal cleavage/methylation domain-containing protein